MPESASDMKVTAEELREAKIPLAFRDLCAHLLIPLNECRKENYFLPGKCHHELHEYETCQYESYKKRVKEKLRQKGAEVEDDK